MATAKPKKLPPRVAAKWDSLDDKQKSRVTGMLKLYSQGKRAAAKKDRYNYQAKKYNSGKTR